MLALDIDAPRGLVDVAALKSEPLARPEARLGGERDEVLVLADLDTDGGEIRGGQRPNLACFRLRVFPAFFTGFTSMRSNATAAARACRNADVAG